MFLLLRGFHYEQTGRSQGVLLKHQCRHGLTVLDSSPSYKIDDGVQVKEGFNFKGHQNCIFGLK